MKDRLLVLGIGNPLMGDEGVGCRLIEHFLSMPEKYPSVDFLDAGTGGLSILHLIAGRGKVIIIDCAYMGAAAGTMKRFLPDETESVKRLAGQSLHEADILKIIDMSRLLGQCPDEIVIFGIEPEQVGPGLSLSGAVAGKISEYAGIIAREFVI